MNRFIDEIEVETIIDENGNTVGWKAKVIKINTGTWINIKDEEK